MRAGIVAIVFFAGLLALGHYVAAPMFCRGALPIPTLDPRALCGADLHFNRSGSVLLYFASIAGAMFFGIVAALIPARGKTQPKEAKEKGEANHAETFEQIIAQEEKKQPAAATVSSDVKPESTPAAAKPAIETESKKEPEKKPEPEKKADTPSASPATAEAANPSTVATAEAITVGLAVTKHAARGGFDGTNEELLERFRELKKQEGVNSIAQAQRLLDESTMSALSKGVDPKAHLSQVAHLVLAEDPDLKSAVVRGVVVHVAARLKELGVAKANLPGAAKGAA